MRAVVAVFVIVALLAPPLGFDAFLPWNAGPIRPPSPAGPTPPSPHLFPGPRAGTGTRGALPAVLIAEVFYFALRDDEYVVLENPTSTGSDLSGWRLTDREGTVEFPANASLAAGDRAVVARNATSYREDTLDDAEYTYGAGNATRMIVVGRIPQLNNDGDEVLLLDPAGTIVDAFVYGGSTYSGSGWTGPAAAKVPLGKRAVRAAVAGQPADTDTAGDWDSPRSYGLGQSELPFRGFDVEGRATAFLSPDDPLASLEGFLDSSTTSIHASVYTLTSPAIGASLRAAAVRGVDVRILLEGGPVGGIDEREWTVARQVAAGGGQVRFLVDDLANDTMARYRFLHAKYAVVDARTVVVGSENWGEHGFPAPGRTGNRGWQVAIEDAGLAAYFEDLFRQDFDPRRQDSVAIEDFRPELFLSNDTASRAAYRFPIPSSRVEGRFRVTPIIAPDHALRGDAVLGLLASATETLDIEAFYIARTWGAVPNPYLEAAIDAARRAVRVRILLDGTWYNVEGDDPVDNDDTAAYVNGVARREGLPLEAKIGNAGSHGLSKFHNKGVLVDNRTAFVSSLNWNRNAATNNREAGLIVESPAFAEPYRVAFEFDWRDDVTSPVADAGPDLVVYADAPVVFSAAGSSDDMGIVSYLWDLGADTRADVAGRVANVTFHYPGTVPVRLTVRDASGNEDNDTALVIVLARGSPDPGLANPLVLPLLTLVAVNVALAWAFVRRRRKGGKGLSEEEAFE